MVPAVVTDAANAVVDRLQAVEAKVDDHDVVISELTAHLGTISTDFKTTVANVEQLALAVVALRNWFAAKPTKALLVLVVGVFAGPEGVQHVKDILGL